MSLEAAATIGGAAMVVIGVALLTAWPVGLVIAGAAAVAWGLLHDDGRNPPAGRQRGPVR